MWGADFGLGVLSGSSYVGTDGLQAWRDIGCTGNLPVEGDDMHWTENCLANEIMTPRLTTNQDALVSSITMGALRDLGYSVNLGEQDNFNLSDLGDCGNFCPASNRRLGETPRTQATPTLSEEGEMELLRAAAERFRRHDEKLQGHPQASNNKFRPNHSVAYLYMENGAYHSRVIDRSQVEHMM